MSFVAPLLALQAATLVRGQKRVLSDFSVQVQAGHGVCLVGANGAGKSSLLRALAGFLPLTAGTLIKPVKIAYCSPQPLLPSPLYVQHWLYEQALLTDQSEKGHDYFEIGPYKNTALQHLSSGWRQRVKLTALTPEAGSVWLLDEAEDSLDDVGQHSLKALLKAQLEAGGAVVAATHTPQLYEAVGFEVRHV